MTPDANGRPVVVPATRQLRLTIVRVKLPFLRRLLALVNGELVLAIMGTVQDVAVVSRSDAQDLLAAGHQSKWLPYQETAAAPPLPLKGPNL